MVLEAINSKSEEAMVVSCRAERTAVKTKEVVAETESETRTCEDSDDGKTRCRGVGVAVRREGPRGKTIWLGIQIDFATWGKSGKQFNPKLIPCLIRVYSCLSVFNTKTRIFSCLIRVDTNRHEFPKHEHRKLVSYSCRVIRVVSKLSGDTISIGGPTGKGRILKACKHKKNTSFSERAIEHLPETAVILSWIFLRQVRRILIAPRIDFGSNFASLVYKINWILASVMDR
ncbi:hypothetical protein LXL04_035493 [Taraxacum kok-saghyz]